MPPLYLLFFNRNLEVSNFCSYTSRGHTGDFTPIPLLVYVVREPTKLAELPAAIRRRWPIDSTLVTSVALFRTCILKLPHDQRQVCRIASHDRPTYHVPNEVQGYSILRICAYTTACKQLLHRCVPTAMIPREGRGYIVERRMSRQVFRQ